MRQLLALGIDAATCTALSARWSQFKLDAVDEHALANAVPIAGQAVVIRSGENALVEQLVPELLSARWDVLVLADACRSTTLLDQWTALAARHGNVLLISNLDRFLPSRQVIQQELESGKLGVPGFVRTHHWRTEALSDGDLLPIDTLVRDVDLVMGLFGQMPERLYATQSVPSGVATMQSLQLHLGFRGGGMALLDFVHGVPCDGGYRALSVIGSTGATYADDHQNMQLVYGPNGVRGVRVDEGLRTLAAWVANFADHLADRRSTVAANRAWRDALSLVDLVARSLATRQAIPCAGA